MMSRNLSPIMIQMVTQIKYSKKHARKLDCVSINKGLGQDLGIRNDGWIDNANHPDRPEGK